MKGRRLTLVRACEVCAADFSPYRKDGRYCSKACSNKATGKKGAGARAFECVTCKEKKPRGEFSRPDKSDRGRYQEDCKSCEAQKRAEQAAERPWYFRRVTYLMSLAKQRAREKGLPFTITRADVVIPDRCPVLGVDFRTPEPNRQYFSNSHAPSIDRIRNDEGYTPGNIVVISCRANSIKGSATIDELEKIYRFYKALHHD